MRSAFIASLKSATLLASFSSWHFLNSAAFAQSGCEDMAERKDGRYQATVSTCGNVHSQTNLSDIELKLEWWGLVGQPIYHYTLKWSPVTDSGGQPYYTISRDGENITLRRADLAEYPDLVKRFDRVKPTDIALTLDLEIYESGASTARYSGRSGTTRLSQTPELTIGLAHEWKQNMTPASPQNTENFIILEGSLDNFCVTRDCKPGVHSGGVSQTLNASGAIRFGPLHLDQISWPNVEIASIHRVFLRREKVKTDAKQAEEKTNADRQNDMWGEDPAAIDYIDKSEVTVRNSLWGDEAGNNKATSVNANVMWGEDPLGSAKGGSMWNKSDGMATAGQIVKDQRGQGVIGANNKVIIPFRDWEILSYRDGVAEVRERSSTSQSCDMDYFVSIGTSTTGIVDASGKFLIKPEKSASIRVSKAADTNLYLTRTTNCVGSGEELRRCQREKAARAERTRRAAEEKKRRERLAKRDCDNRVQSVRSRYRSQGYKVN